ncbi:MAG: hypothetical protein FJ088_11240, partial [Deltaproteobacteria bacterium]|nr:hypothetical protein [Deltaproteobacteria bacterium]
MLDDNYAPLSHDHDALYYSKGETDTKLTGKSDTGHQHDDLYYQKSYLDGQFALKSDVGHAHDDLYYGKTYMDAALLGKSDAAHSHDDLYYQKSYIDTALSGKSDAAHNHDNLYYTETEVDTLLLGKVGVAQADSITSAMIANGAIKFEDIGQNQCAAGQVMKWSGTSGKWECANDDTRSQAEVENWAKGVCLDSEGELTALLNDNYAATSHSHGAADIASGTLDNERLSSSVSLLGQTIESGEISDGTIVNDDLAANAAISYGKLNLIGSLTNSDVSSSAGISYGKLNLSGSITDSDISSSANIPDTKLAVISTAGKVADSALSSNVSKFGSSVNLDSSETTGVLPVAKGGTGLSAAGSAGNLLR